MTSYVLEAFYQSNQAHIIWSLWFLSSFYPSAAPFSVLPLLTYACVAVPVCPFASDIF